MRHVVKATAVTVGLAGAVLVLALGAHPAAQPGWTVVMSGLDNPRGITFGPEGALYVAEAGRGGAGPCAVNGPGETRCFGTSGAISRWWDGEQARVVTGLPSHALPSGDSATGPNDISMLGRGAAFVTLGLGGGPEFREALGPAAEQMGTVIHVAASGQWRTIADILQHEEDANPGAGPVDSNAFGLLTQPAERLVTDAGGNALLRVGANGRVETVAIFPSRPQGRATDAVPTALTLGPDGAYYVGELTGVPFAAGAARIYRVVPGQAPEIYLEGFKTILDLAFDADENLYVVEHAGGAVFFGAPGRLLKITPTGTRTTLLGGLDRPTGVTVGPDGAVYVTNHGITAGAGEVIRIEP